MKTRLEAMNCALDGVFDYAGMFPPAELELPAVVQAYREYRQSTSAWALGDLVIDAKKLCALRKELHGEALGLRLSVVAAEEDLDSIQQHLDEGLPIRMIEMKTVGPEAVFRVQKNLPREIPTYLELPIGLRELEAADAIAEAGMCAKLRMGGVIAEAFPLAVSVAKILKEISTRGIAFKATAGLHHPLRSEHPFSYCQNSKIGIMHGFMNLLCAAALVWFGGEEDEAAQLLEEQDPKAWQVKEDAICWRTWDWSAKDLRVVRQGFLRSIGTCSFLEPMSDLEALGWR